MTPAAILRAAAQELRDHGWCQHEGEDEKGRHCALGAIGVVAGLGQYETATVLRIYLKTPYIGDWNDTPGRTQEEVIAALEAAASSTESQNANQ